MSDIEEIQFLKSVGYKPIASYTIETNYGLNEFDNHFIKHYHHRNTFNVGGIADHTFDSLLIYLNLSNEYKLWKRNRTIKKILNND